MKLDDFLKYAALAKQIVGMIELAINNDDGDETSTESFVVKANELAEWIHANARAGVAFDQDLADRVNALAAEFEARAGRQTPEGYRAKADEVADLVARFNTKLEARRAAESGS